MTLFRTRPAQALPAREGRWLVLAGEVRTVVPTASLSLLEFCTPCRTLEGHESAYATANHLTRDRLPALRSAFEDLLRRNLLEEVPRFEPESPIQIVVLPNGGSPLADQSLRSFSENAKAFGHPVRFIVCGDRSHDSLRELWVRRLTTVVPERLARFLLSGLPPAQTDRNLALLCAAGEKALCVDDGAVCEWRPSLERRPGLNVTAHNPNRSWSHPSREAAMASAAPEDFDVLQAMGERLGPAIHAGDHGIISRVPIPERVAVVQAGLCGNTPADSVSDRLMDQWQIPWATIAATEETLTTKPQTMMTACVGLDGRQPLVPFPPTGKNRERVFCRLLAMTQPRLAFRHLPWTIWRDCPMPECSLRNDTLLEFFDWNSALLALLEYFNPTSLRSAGGWLKQAAQDASFHDLLTELRCEALCKKLDSLDGALAERGVRAAIEEILIGPRLLAGAEGLGDYVRSYGELLEQWPAIWDCARSFAGERS